MAAAHQEQKQKDAEQHKEYRHFYQFPRAAAFLLPRYRRGTAAAFRLGRQHGVFCLGCCWALMLVMFAAGVANLAWMALLGTVMAYEKVAARGERVVPVVGVTLLTWAALVAAHPAWLPHALAGVH